MSEPRGVRPRPTPGGSARIGYSSGDATDGREWMGHTPATAPLTTPPATVPTPQPSPDPGLADDVVRLDRIATGASAATPIVVPQPSQVVAAAGGAIVSAARVSRLLGRSGWRIARQVPGARLVGTEARRLQHAALGEARRLLVSDRDAGRRPVNPSRPTTDEQRAIRLVERGTYDPAPLRTAMGELLGRAADATHRDSREYLFGTIISQLTPDEARILATLAGGRRYAAADVVLSRRGDDRVVLANASTIGRQAALAVPGNTPTYLTRLHTFGLVTFGPEDASLVSQYDLLASDPAVDAARQVVAAGRGRVKLVRKTVGLSPFGAEFWTATDPSRPAPR